MQDHRIPENKRLTEQVFTRLTPDERRAAERWALKKGHNSLSEWLRALVRQELTTG